MRKFILLMFIIMNVVVFVLLNNQASLYNKEIISFNWVKRPFQFSLARFAGVNHLYDERKEYPIIYVNHEFPVGRNDLYHDDKIFIRELSRLMWNDSVLVAEVELENKRNINFIVIKKYVRESYIAEYELKEMVEVDDFFVEIDLNEQPFSVKFWGVIGIVQMLIFGMSFMGLIPTRRRITKH